MAENKSWRDYLDSVKTGDKSNSNKTETWRDYLSNYTTGSDKPTTGDNSSVGWRDQIGSHVANAVGRDIVNRVNNWLQGHNDYVTGYQSRYSDRKWNYEDAYVSDSADWLDSISKQHETSKQEANAILDYLDQNKDYLDAGWVNKVRNAIISANQQQRSLVTGATSDYEYWNSWASKEMLDKYGSAENAYNAAQREYGYYNNYQGKSYNDLLGIIGTLDDGEEKDWLSSYAASVGYNEKSKYDLVKGQESIAEMESVLKRVEDIVSSSYGIGGQDADDAILNEVQKIINEYSNGQYSTINQLKNAISQKREYHTDAERIQKSIELSSVADSSSDLYDPEFTQHSSYVSVGKMPLIPDYKDIVYGIINGDQAAKEGRTMATGWGKISDVEKSRLDAIQYMTEEEKALYNYYYNKHGYEAAEEYLSGIIDSLNAWQGESMFKQIEGNTGLELVFSLAAGLDQFNSGIENLFSKDDYIPTSATQYASGLIREDLKDIDLKWYDFSTGEWKNQTIFGNSLGQSIYDFGTTTANMAPSILVSSLVGSINPVAGAITGNTMMGASAAGNAYQEVINRGYGKAEARMYSTSVGVSEATLQYLLGGIGKLGGVSSKLAKAVEGIDKGLLRFALQYGGKMASEGLEEGLQEILDPILKNAILHADEDINWSEVAYSALLGWMSAGLMEGPGTAINVATEQKFKKKYGDSTEDLIKEGLESDVNSDSYKLATEYKAKIEAKKTLTGAEIRKLVAANEAQFKAEDYNDTVSQAKTRFAELGETGNVEELAQLAAKRATGQDLTRAEKSILANSQFGSKVAKELKDAKEGKTTVYKSLEERAGTESKLSVSESGQAEIKGESVSLKKAEVKEFIKDKTGKITDMVIKADGKEVKASEIDYADGDQSYLFYAVPKIENISPRAATTIIRDYDPSSGQTVGEYLNGIDEGFTYGYYGYSEADLKAGKFAPKLTEKQMKTAYELGRFDRENGDANADAHIVKMRTAAEAKMTVEQKTAKQKERIESDDVEVYFQDGKSVVKFDEHAGKYGKKRMAAVNTAKFLSKLGIGGKYYFFESYVNADGDRVYKDADGNEVEAPNGMYEEADGSIHIDLNAGDYGQGTALFTLGHELTHFIKAQSKKQFKVLGDLVTEAFDKTDLSMHKRVLEKQKFLEDKRGKKVSYDEAFEEVVADAMSTMISDGSFFEMLMEIKVKDKGLFNTIKRFFEKLIAKFRKEYEELTPDQRDAQDIRQMKDMFDRIQTAFVEGLVEASDNFHAAMESVVESKAEPMPAEETVTDGAVVTDGAGERFSIRSMKHDIAQGKMFEDLKNVCGWTNAQVDTLRTQLKDLVEYMIPYRTILDMNETYDMEGRRFSPYKPNSDPLYKISMDFSTLCSKRLLTQYVIEQLQLRENRPMSAEEQMAIRDMLNEYRKVEKGLQVACSMCYVEAARLKSPKQIQRWLNDPTPHLVNYFAQKNTEFNASVKKTQADFKESKGYDRETPKKDMKPADVKELNKIGPRLRAQYKLSAEEQAIVERAKALPNGTYLTAGNLADLSESEPVIYNAYTSFVRTATRSKSLEKDEPYYYGDSARDNGNGIVVTDSFIEAVNRENGMRFSSWSDWRIIHLLDYITAVIDNSVRGAAMHGYTKFGDEVRVLGKTGMMFNMSGVTGTQTGLNEDGSLNFSETESINVDEAIQLRDEFPETAGLQCIGVSDAHIIALLRSEIIDYVIPYHVSGLNADLRRMAKIYGWDDYTGTQNASIDKSIKYEDAVDKEHWREEPVFSEFFVGYDTGMSGIDAMRESAERYKKMCKDRGLKPKFEQFANEDNYWKLLIDRKMINQQTGNLIQQQAVTPTFDFNVIKGIVDKFVENYDAGLEGRALNHIVENWDSIPQRIKDLKKGGTKAKKTAKAVDTLSNQTLAAQPNDVVKNSDRNHKWNPVLDSTEWGVVNYAVEHNQGTEITSACNMFYEKIKGRTVFGIYSTEDSTLLYASRKETAEREHLFLEQFLKEYENGNVTDTSAEGLYTWAKTVRMQQDAGTGDDSGDVAPRRSAGDATLYGRPSGLYASAALRNVLENIFQKETAGRTGDGSVKNSERFNRENDDIRYSERGEGASNRSLLANAFETISQNSEEYKLIQRYKGHIAELNSLENRLSEMNAEIRKLQYGKGAERNAEKLRRLEGEAEKIAEAINSHDRKLVSLEASEPLRKIIEREREKASKKTKEHIAEIQQNKMARAEQTELRHKIRKTVRDLDKLLKRGNKQRNVKEDMKGFVSKALELADYLFTDHISNDDLIRNGITVRMTPREAAIVKETEDILSQLYDNIGSLTPEEYAQLDAKRKSNMDKLRDLLTSQRNERLNTPVYNLFNDLVTEYASLKNSKQDAVKAAYDPNVERFLREYMGESNGETDSDRKSLLQNMRVADMTTKELQHLLYAYTMVMTSVRDANKLHIKGKTETIEQMAGRIMSDFSGRKTPDGKVKTVLRNLSNKIGWDYEKLYYALDRIGSEAFTELVMNIANSENIVMQDVMEAAAFRDEMVKNYGFNNWDVNKKIDREFMDNTGKKFKLTLGQMMALYAYSRRKGAWDHIEYGGFVFGDRELTNPKPADSYKLSKAQCEAITNLLTKEQKGYVEAMQKFLSETMGAKGNEVSMQLYGIKMFTEKNYFPIHIAGQFKAQANESQAKAAAGFSSMSNAGFTHAQNPNAKAPFVLEGFNDVWADHVNEMSRYHGTVPALEDMRKVMNRSFYSESTAESLAIKQMMENSFGKEAVDYFDNLYKEANSGAITDKLQKKSKKLLSLFRKNSVAYSLSVLVQQAASMVRAYAMIDRKYFGFKGVGAITSGVAKAVSDKWTKAHTNAYNEMLKYAPGVTMAKEIGGFDTATGGSIRSYLLDTKKGFFQTMKTGTHMEKAKAHLDKVDNNAIANLPNVADKIAWIEIWNACKRETAAKHKDLATSSEEFMQLVGERFTEVIRATQVYDSIFAKSPMLKSKNLYVQMLVSFMNEPNTIANMVEKAMRDVTKGDWKSGVRTAAVVVHSIIFTNVLKSIIYAMRDDDEDETYWEKYIEAITGNMMNDFWVLNYIPVARDVWSLAQGYDVERADMAIVADAVDALGRVIKNAFTDTDEMTEEQLIEFDKKVTESNWKLVESIASFFGIPVKNIRREIDGVFDHMRIASANAGMTTSKSAWDKVYDAVIDSIPFMPNKHTKTDKIYEAIIIGDKTYVERLKSTYVDKDGNFDKSKYNTAVRKALRENDPRIHEAAQARYDGNTEEYKRIFREIQKEGKFSFDDIMSAVNSEESAIRNKLEPEKATSSYTANGFVEAVAMGNATEAQAMKDEIIATKVANGKTQEEAEKEFASDVATGIGKAYSSGLLDEAQAEKMLMEYAGKDEEEAASKVSYWAFCEEHPQYEDVFTESHVGKYHEFAEPENVSVDVYAQFITGTKGLKNIKDQWGNVEKTVREQTLEVIDSLPLTWKQKDALYLAADLAESKIWDVPW